MKRAGIKISFIIAMHMLLTGTGGVQAEIGEFSLDTETRIVAVSGTYEEPFYVRAINETARQNGDMREGFRYLRYIEPNMDGEFETKFYAPDGGNYKIYVTTPDGESIKEESISVSNPQLLLSGGGVSGRKVNLICNIPKMSVGSKGKILFEFDTTSLRMDGNSITADACSYTYSAEGSTHAIEFEITDSSMVPRIYLTMTMDETAQESEVTVKVIEFTTESFWGDTIKCDYTENNTFALSSLSELNEKLADVERLINSLPAASDITGAMYEETVKLNKNANDAVLAAVSIGAVKNEDISQELLEKLESVGNRLNEMQPGMEALFSVIEVESDAAKFEAIAANKVLLGITDDTISSVEASDVKEKILKAIGEKDCYEIDILQKHIGECILLSELTVTEYDKIKELAQSVSYLTGFDMKEVPQSTLKIIEKREFSDLEALQKAIEAAEAEKTPSIDSSQKPVSGQISIGGGGGGGGVAYVPPVAKPNEESNGSEMSEKTVFSDIDSTDWAKQHILSLCEKNILSGYDDKSFRPNNNITRAEFVKIIVNALKLTGALTTDFEDVDEDAWHADFIAVAYANNIIKGISDNVFGVNDYITREDMAVIITRAIQAESSAEPGFADSDHISDYARNAVSVMRERGYMDGFEDGEFKPKLNVTRAMAAKVIDLVLEDAEVSVNGE